MRCDDDASSRHGGGHPVQQGRRTTVSTGARQLACDPCGLLSRPVAPGHEVRAAGESTSRSTVGATSYVAVNLNDGVNVDVNPSMSTTGLCSDRHRDARVTFTAPSPAVAGLAFATRHA